MTTALLDRIRKALESVPMKKFTASCVDGCFLGDEMKMEMDEPDYHALAAKIAPLVEVLERSQHHLECAKWEYAKDFDSEPCTCGRDAALAPLAHGGEPMKRKHSHRWGKWLGRMRLCIDGWCPVGQYRGNYRLFVARPMRKVSAGSWQGST